MSEIDMVIRWVISVLFNEGCRSAVKYISDNQVVKATRRFKPNKMSKREEILLTIGQPNYAERKFIKRCKKSCAYKMQNVITKPYPSKKSKAKK